MEDKLKHLHIVIATDDNYVEFVSVVVKSIFTNNLQFSCITIHLLANDVSENSVCKLRRHIPGETGELLIYDISDIKQKLGVAVPDTISISSYARLFIAELLPTNINLVLYLDCDVVVSDNIEEFWATDMRNYLVAGVLDTLPDEKAKTDIGLLINDPYINAGVLLINLQLWRELNIQHKFMEFLQKHNGIVHHHDQGVINAVSNNRKKIVHPRYNLTSNYLSHPYHVLRSTNTPFYEEAEIKGAIKSPAIIHFTQGFYNRPWIVNSNHPFKEVFGRYHSMTEWKNAPLRKDNRSLIVRIISWSFLNMPYSIYVLLQRVLLLIKSLVK